MRFVLHIQYVAIVGMRTELPCCPTRVWANVGGHAARTWAAAICLAVGAARKHREGKASIVRFVQGAFWVFWPRST